MKLQQNVDNLVNVGGRITDDEEAFYIAADMGRQISSNIKLGKLDRNDLTAEEELSLYSWQFLSRWQKKMRLKDISWIVIQFPGMAD